MFKPRLTYPILDFPDPDKTKLYAITATDRPLDPTNYLDRLKQEKQRRAIDWLRTPSFAILHEGATLRYLVLAWWGNDNELFNSVSVEENGTWVSNSEKYSFCLYDLEVIWHERNSFIKHLYSGTMNLDGYEADYFH